MANSSLTAFAYDERMIGRSSSKGWWTAVSAIALAAFLLRLAASRGGLWADEAWSMLYAQQAHDPAGVFLRINHDNNHHLISLWLQLVGIDARPWLVRLPPILAGSGAVFIAAMIAARRSAGAGIIAALLFAFSPIMVTYGSEARGYAPMMLAALTMLLLVTRSLDAGETRLSWWLGLVSLLGMLSHMTMAAVVGLVSLWVYFERRAVKGPSAALKYSLSLLAPSLIAAAAVPVLVFSAALLSPTGMRVGGYIPFSWEQYGEALSALAGWTFGLTATNGWLALPIVALAFALIILWPPRWLAERARLYAILILGVPAALALIHAPNTGFARYFLCSALGLLLLASEWISSLIRGALAARAGAAAALGTILLASLLQDASLLMIARGHPEEIIQLMRQQSPRGARLALETPRLEAVARIAAAQGRYPLDVVGGCAPADFLVSSEPARLAAPGPLRRCGIAMTPVGSGWGTALTGDRWILYRADPSLELASR